MKYSAAKLFGAGFQRRYFIFDGATMSYYKKSPADGGKAVKNERLPLASLNRVVIPSSVAAPSQGRRSPGAAAAGGVQLESSSVDLIFTSRTFTVGAVAAEIDKASGRPDSTARDESLLFIALLQGLLDAAHTQAEQQDQSSALSTSQVEEQGTVVAGKVASPPASIKRLKKKKKKGNMCGGGGGGGGAAEDGPSTASSSSTTAADDEKLAKRTRKMIFVLREILSTETNYAASLATVCTAVVEPLRAKLEVCVELPKSVYQSIITGLFTYFALIIIVIITTFRQQRGPSLS